MPGLSSHTELKKRKEKKLKPVKDAPIKVTSLRTGGRGNSPGGAGSPSPRLPSALRQRQEAVRQPREVAVEGLTQHHIQPSVVLQEGRVLSSRGGERSPNPRTGPRAFR